MKKTVLLSAVVNLTKKEKRQAIMPKSTTSMLLPRQEDRPIPAGPEKGPADIHGYDPGLTLVPPSWGTGVPTHSLTGSLGMCPRYLLARNNTQKH